MDLEELHDSKYKETLKALEVLAGTKRHALVQLQKTQILFKHLKWKQQEFINNRLEGNFLIQSIYENQSQTAAGGLLPELAGQLVPAARSSQVQRTRAVRKNLLQFGIIQARAAELIEAIAKSTAVFNCQYKACCRELFPLGCISRLFRRVRQLFNYPYFSWKDMGSLQNLGMAAAFVVKMAEAPVIGGQR